VRLLFQTVGSGTQVAACPKDSICWSTCIAPGRMLVFDDVRNRGRSDTVIDPSKLARGIHKDVDDLDAVRLHFGLDRLNLIGHSYIG
jgi:pimeloyl-ACP methyl ester carboxylesterase